MNITDTELLYLMGYSVLLGVALGLCYVVFSFLRLLFSPIDPKSAKGRALCDTVYFVCDVLFSLFAGICVSLMFFGLNHGRVRLTGLLGCGAGFCLWHFTLGRWLVKLFSRCVSVVRKVMLFLYDRSVGAMIRLILRVLRRMLVPIVSVIRPKKKTKRKGKDEKLEFLG